LIGCSCVDGEGDKLPVVLIMGATATGKTDLAITLARELPIEIVSVDSALVYRGLDIGTGKPSAELRAEVPHHLIDICDPRESYSAGRFVADAVRLIHEITERGKLPVLVGGTMLYYRALTRGIASLPSADTDIRGEIDARAAKEGWPMLHAELQRHDPVAAARILPNDGQRIQRALEVLRLTGRTLSELQADTRPPDPRLAFTSIAWNIADRTLLYDRIERRYRQMLADGFLTEVQRLRARGDLNSELPAIRAVGYRQMWAYLEDECNWEEAVTRSIVATRHLARRQLIWLRADKQLHWIEASSHTAVHDVRERVCPLIR
jgi:tRNA dimethylallyltransferase